MSVYDIPPDPVIAELRERVAALEERVLHPLYITWPLLPPLTEAQEAELRESAAEALKLGPFTHRVIQQPPPLTPDEVRQLLRECVMVVKPGETLVIRGRDWTPGQVREVQNWMDADHQSGRIDFRVLAVIGDELGVVQPESDEVFAARVMDAVNALFVKADSAGYVHAHAQPKGNGVWWPSREGGEAPGDT